MGVGQEILINMDFKFQVLVLACCLGISQSLDCKDCEMSCTSGKMDQCTGEPDGGEYCLPKIAEDMDGCRMQDFCHPKYSSSMSGNGGLCPESCPVHCGQDQQMCPGREYDGCREPDQCWPKMSMGPKGKECYEHCPTYCKDEEIMCPGGEDMDGCKMSDMCYPKYTPGHGGNGQMCRTQCPANCHYDETMCPGRVMDGCLEPDYCMPKEYPSPKAEMMCPNHCQTYCSDMDQICPGGENMDGCKEPDFCVPKDSFCPPKCGDDEMSCPGAKDDYTHQQIGPDYCMPKENGDCQNFCPVDCDYDSNVCQGGFDDQGCPMPDYCLSRYIAVSGQSGQLCPQYFPPICAKEDKLCPGKEFEGGCRDYSVCVPAKDSCPNGDWPKK